MIAWSGLEEGKGGETYSGWKRRDKSEGRREMKDHGRGKKEVKRQIQYVSYFSSNQDGSGHHGFFRMCLQS